MNSINSIESIARRLDTVIRNQQGVRPIPTKDYGWENHRYSSPRFRLAHVEIFKQERFAVVHCCIFPHVSDPSPIFGFDVISGESKITGVFMDLSPTVNDPQPFTDLDVGRSRDRPEWGAIFSPYWLACRPTQEEMQLIGNESVAVLERYLTTLGAVGLISEIAIAQNRYCTQQQKNEHTRKALVNLLGQSGADEFMREILFPTANEGL